MDPSQLAIDRSGLRHQGDDIVFRSMNTEVRCGSRSASIAAADVDTQRELATCGSVLLEGCH
jgi:hypothetical protein